MTCVSSPFRTALIDAHTNVITASDITADRKHLATVSLDFMLKVSPKQISLNFHLIEITYLFSGVCVSLLCFFLFHLLSVILNKLFFICLFYLSLLMGI